MLKTLSPEEQRKVEDKRKKKENQKNKMRMQKFLKV